MISHRAEQAAPEDATARCHAARSDGECFWQHCPQERDGEPEKSGRHCPYDHWCYYCGEDETEGDHKC